MPISAEVAFEAVLAELEGIVAALERGGPDLGAALSGYARGVELLGHCQGVLDQAERSVALLTGVDDAGRAVTAPFDGSATLTAAVEVAVEAPAPSPVPDPPRAPSAPPEAPF